jgi:hypothetical protein
LHHLGTPAPKITDRKKSNSTREIPGGKRTGADKRRREGGREDSRGVQRTNKPKAKEEVEVEKTVEGEEELFFWDFRGRSPRS